MKSPSLNGSNADPLLRNYFDDTENLYPSNWINAFDTSSPSLNITEDRSCFCVDIMAKGFRKEDFSVYIEDNIITITARTQPGIQYNFFKHSFHLPENIKQDVITAMYKNGSLKLHIPKHVPLRKKQVQVE